MHSSLSPIASLSLSPVAGRRYRRLPFSVSLLLCRGFVSVVGHGFVAVAGCGFVAVTGCGFVAVTGCVFFAVVCYESSISPVTVFRCHCFYVAGSSVSSVAGSSLLPVAGSSLSPVAGSSLSPTVCSSLSSVASHRYRRLPFSLSLLLCRGFIGVVGHGFVAVANCGFVAVAGCGFVAVAGCGFAAVAGCGFAAVASCESSISLVTVFVVVAFILSVRQSHRSRVRRCRRLSVSQSLLYVSNSSLALVLS